MQGMYVDAIALVLVLFYGFLGYRYGLTGALINLAGMVGGYIAAVMYAREGAVMLAERTQMSPLLALPIASVLIFLVVTRTFYLLHLLVRKLLEGDKTGPSPLLTADRMGGLVFGLVKGFAIVAFLLWGLPTLIGSGTLASQMGFSESNVTALVRGMIEAGSRYGFSMMTDDPNAQSVLAHAVSEPRVVLQEAANLVANPSLKGLVSDPGVQTKLRAQDFVGVVNSSQFDAVLADEAFQQSLKTIGFQPANGRTVTREEVGRMVLNVNTQMQKQLAQMKNAASTKEMQAMLADPAVQEHLKKGEITEVLRDPRLARAMGMDVPAGAATPAAATPAAGPIPSGEPRGMPPRFPDGTPAGRDEPTGGF